MVKVSSKTNPRKLAFALFRKFEETNGKEIVAQAIGPEAVNQLVKGVAIARGMAAPKGYNIVFEPSFTDLETKDGKISGIRIRILAC